MGRRLDQFTLKHPVCAFCAGSRPTTSRDHQPARVFFRSKRAPDEIEVPACDPCQSISRRAENLLSVSLVPAEISLKDFDDWHRRIDHIRRNDPDCLPRPPENTREVRRIMRELGLELPGGMAYNEFPIVTLDADEYDKLLEVFARKIVLAQHYRCFSRPLSRTGAMYAKAIPRPHVGDGEWLDEILADLPRVDVGKHGNEDLGEQIMTRWHASSDGRLGMFVTHIHREMVIIGMTGESERWRNFLTEWGELSGPFP